MALVTTRKPPSRGWRLLGAVAAALCAVGAQSSLTAAPVSAKGAPAPTEVAVRIDPARTTIAAINRAYGTVLVSTSSGVAGTYLVRIAPGADADLVAEAIAALPAPPVLIGHSMGGLMGLMLARQHPEDVGRLMVVDSLPFYAMVFSPQATVETARPQAAAMRDRTIAATPGAWTAMETAMMTRLVKSPEGLKSATVSLRADEALPGEDAGERWVSLAVFSAGAVIPPEIERHRFEPFFSTRSRGSGLGLYICRELCERYGARIDYRLRPLAEPCRNEFFVVMRRLPLPEYDMAETRLQLPT